MCDLGLGEVVEELVARDVQSSGGDDATFVHGILVGVPQRDHLQLAGVLRNVEHVEPAQQSLGLSSAAAQVVGELFQLAALRDAGEAPDAHAHGVHGTGAEEGDDAVAELAQGQ